MTYALLPLLPLAFVIGRYVGLAKARALAETVRQAKARGLTPELRGTEL